MATKGKTVAKKPEDAELDNPVEETEPAVEETTPEVEEEVVEEEAGNASDSVEVFNSDGNLIRVYSKKVHGAKYLDLAKQFVSKKGREGYSLK